jgi:DNA-binding response OmpR family regulator
VETKNVYIIEDDPHHIELLREILIDEDYLNLTIFSDGIEGYLEILRNPPDLLIVDIILPSISGLAVARLLKFHDDYRHIPIIIISSITEPGIDEKASKMGADAFIAKPFKPVELLDRVATLAYNN